MSKSLSLDIEKSSVFFSRLMLNIEKFDIGQSYITSKVFNKHNDIVNINIEGGRKGIDLQGTLFKIGKKLPDFVYLRTTIRVTNKVLIRKLPVLGVKDWLLIYDDAFFLYGVNDGYDEIEFFY